MTWEVVALVINIVVVVSVHQQPIRVHYRLNKKKFEGHPDTTVLDRKGLELDQKFQRRKVCNNK